jgi:hypothetical protein
MDDDKLVIFTITASGKNIIDMGPHGRLVFSDMTRTKEGYRYMTYSRSFIDTISVKKQDGSRSTYDIPSRDSYVFNMRFKRGQNSSDKKIKAKKGPIKGVPSGTIPPELLNWLTKVFESLSDGYVFPFKNILLLKEKIENTDFNRILEPKKRKISKKKIKEEEEAIEILNRSIE